MENSAVEGLQARIGRLERQQRRLRRALGGAVVVVAAVVLMGAASDSGKTIEAKRFLVVDGKGNGRAELGLEDSGEPRLVLFGKDRKPRVVLSVTADGNAGVGLVDDRGKRRLALDLLAGGVPRLALYDRSDNARAALVVLEDGEGTLALYDKDGKPIATAR